MKVSKEEAALSVRAIEYSQTLGMAGCDRAWERLKRAARDYANSLRVPVCAECGFPKNCHADKPVTAHRFTARP